MEAVLRLWIPRTVPRLDISVGRAVLQFAIGGHLLPWAMSERTCYFFSPQKTELAGHGFDVYAVATHGTAGRAFRMLEPI